MTTESLRELRRFHFDPRDNRETGAGFRPLVLAAVAGETAEKKTSAPPSPASDHVWLHRLAQAAGAEPRSRQATFREQVRAALAEGRRLHGASKVAESDGLGALGARFLDSGALTRVLEHQHATAGSAADGLAAALAVLESFHAQAEPPVLRLLFEDGLDLPVIEGLAATAAGEPCAAAAEVFDRVADELAQVLRALRRVRLELVGEYQPARHDLWLEQLDWQAFSRDELGLLAPVVAVLSADAAASGGMVALSRLLLSGRPVQVVVLSDPLAQPGTAGASEPLAGYRFEPGFLALAHREVLVSQTSPSAPAHMQRGFARALAAAHAALHVVAVVKREAGEARAAAEIASRAHPLFGYDPERSSHWAERLDLADNPQPEADWPVDVFETGSQQLPLAFTFADLALLEPSYADSFRPAPDDVEPEQLVPIATWASAEAVEGTALPFVWAVDGSGRRCRLVVSRPLALACRDRLGFWRLLQELAGVKNEPARRAAEAAREEAMLSARAERERLVAAHAQEIERLQRHAAEEVVDKLTAALLEVDVAELVAPVVPSSAPAGVVSGFAGQSIDEVTAMLMRFVDPATLDQASSGSGDGRSGQVAAELLRLVGEG